MRGPGRGRGGYWNEPRGRGERSGNSDSRQDFHPRDPIDHGPYGHARDDHYRRGVDGQQPGRDNNYRQDDPYRRDRRDEEPHAQGGTYSQDRSTHPYLPDRGDNPYSLERRSNHHMMDSRQDPHARDMREDPYLRDPHTRERRTDPYSRDSYPRDARRDPYGSDRMDDPYARDIRDPIGRGNRGNSYPDRRDEQDGFRGHPNEPYTVGSRSQPSQDKPMGGLIQKLNDCIIKDEDDAKLATSVITSLAKSLKDYNTISGKPNIASVMTEVELSIHKVKAMRVALRVLGTGPQTGQTTSK